MADKYTPQAIWGRELRHYRQVAGFTQAQLAQRIHFSESLISGIETGQLPASPEFAQACDTTLSTGGALHRLLDWRKGSPFPEWFGKWQDKERVATVVKAYESLLIPGLLQTPAYATEVLFGDESAVQARLARQEIFMRRDPPPPMLRFVIDESVLHRLIGTTETMYEQLRHLVSVVSPRISVQIVPVGGMHPGLDAGFMVATLEGGSELAYLDTAVRGLVTADQDDVTAAMAKFEAIRVEALPQQMSVDLINRTAEDRWTSATSLGGNPATRVAMEETA
ncbi:transcriptional regulator [Sphaerisporangium siamense]|uniref:Transcriptional regulator with XRE-family HTH domain n=1 Tax=Sphaerisporangium siamense TaxID=795645 RepID=A0A7W7D1C7_9ACTN|nr:helix-turn-helix transcriptional regulator [Sphaerisporangium siamense]MBB4698488.1 transcriptional regulator with XRE-family HTH domain [Sphaerisporangium siamense]GII85452.1 transcriptional regulator [Sphaerisporangium siamense]